MFLYYTDEGSDDAIGHSTKQCNTQSRISLESKTWHQKCTSQLKKQNYDNYVSGPVLIANKIPRFRLMQGSLTPNNLIGRVKAMWEPCLFQGRPPVPLKKVANGDIWFFTERDWSQGCCHGNYIEGVILFLLGFTFPIFLEIFLTQYFIVLVELLKTSSLSSFASYKKKCEYLQTKQDIPKRKMPL